MCGIWAAFGGPVALGPAATWKERVAALTARGPEGTRVADISGYNAILGFTRLAINGLTDAGMQPMSLGATSWVTNGEIYNWRDLALAHGLTLTSGSDCEVIGALYERLDGDCDRVFAALDGVFATVLVDVARGRFVVARDPFGVRPLFFGWREAQFFFSSELKGLPQDCKPTPIHITPGSYSVYDLKTLDYIDSGRYFRLPTVKLPAFETVEAASSAVRVALEAAVKKRMMTERPCAALLSGGVDSSLIASLVARELRACGAPPLKTFSIGMAGSEDLRYARMVADWIGSDHTEVVVTAAEMWSSVSAVIRDIESYDTTTVRASVGNWLVAEAIREKSDCKVVFNGDGSDEVFGSYLYFNSAPSAVEYEEEVRRLLREIHAYDVLRSDRSISSHGLEPRTPFLDKAFVATVMSLPVWMRRPLAAGHGAKPEKWLLRRAFDDGVTLPREVLWRRKEAFSDGVSGAEKSWYEQAREFAAAVVPAGWASDAISGLKPTTEEMYLYRQLFENCYPGWGGVLKYFWMPRWSAATDPSARVLGVYK